MIGGVVALFLAWVVVRSITVPVAGMVEAMIGLAGGDTTVEIPARERRDEVGDMAKAVEVFKRNAIERLRLEAQEKQEIEARQARHARIETLTDEFDKAVINLLKGVGDAASTMLDTAGTLTANAELTQSQSAAVSSATEQASTNVNVIAAASTELLASVQEIGSQVTRAATISSNAVAEAHDTNDKVSGLAAAANRVGEVVGLITSIANQTNLLALNATIEAARAGEAGKGFAVVASEVKNLASQTAKATEEIAGQIGAIQAQTEDTVAAIRRIISVIGEINEMSSAIAGAVEEQGAAMQEVVRNVEEAAKGTSEVARSIVQVAEAAEGTGRMAGSVQSAANSLTRQNDSLRVTVEGFLSSIKAT
jgi:methyl-accepting chemotaxis protein